MSDYNELIKKLRNRRMCIQGLGTLNDYPLLCEAADAIEKLEHQVFLADLACKAEAAKAPRWIPVTERLPEVSGHYLICLECKCDGELFSAWMQVAWFCEKFYWEHLHSGDVFKETVTHWMPLPEPPKEE